MTTEHASYIPERDYKSREYKPFKCGFEDMCGHCKAYYNELYERKLIEDPFPPTCQGDRSDQIKKISKEDFESEDEYIQACILLDPTIWAYYEFDSPDGNGRWVPRWYQKEVLLCSAQFKAVRGGRRSGKTAGACIDLLHHAVTKANARVLVIAPYDRQTTKIFDDLRTLIANSRSLRNSIIRDVKNPQRIELANGSQILGFSAGSKTAAKSDKIRGQDATFIYIDEIDYIGDQDLEAILAIIASHPDCKLIATTTPTGEHKLFYKLITDKSAGFKEFHFISAESPQWTKKTEAFYRATYSRAAYEHEFLAEFGQQEGGVYRNELIDAYLEDYSIDEYTPEPHKTYIMGIDWNKNVGTHILIVEVLTHGPSQKFRPVQKIIVPKSEFTQSTAVDLIFDLDSRYGQFKGIWVDKGYGQTQVEYIKKISLLRPGSSLHKRVFAIGMAEHLEIKDPETGQSVTKPAKPFLVEALANQLEEGNLILPKSEDTTVVASDKQHGLVQQMRNYKIEGYSVLGVPRYSQGQDHTLVAFQLAVGGYLLKYGNFFRANYVSKVAFLDPSGAVNASYLIKEQEKELKKGGFINMGRSLESSSINPVIDSAGFIRQEKTPDIMVNRQKLKQANRNIIRPSKRSWNSGRRRTF